MNRTIIKRITAYCVMSLCLIMLTGCAGNKQTLAEAMSESDDTGFVVTKAGMYDSADNEAVIIGRDADKKTITFLCLELGRKYTLNYDGATKFYDKYDSAMTVDQVEAGSIVDITFLKAKKLLNSVKESPSAFVIDSEGDFSIEEENKRMVIGPKEYKLEGALVLNDGKPAELMDINAVDGIRVRGIDSRVISINITDGHGYLRLSGADYFEGGWIEINKRMIKKVTKDMLIAVPTGRVSVSLSKGSVTFEEEYDVREGEECVVELNETNFTEPDAEGTVIFVTTPSNATVYIDGESVDTSMPALLSFGIHQLMAKADGYQTLTQYIKVGTKNATLDITLEPADSNSVSPTVSVAVDGVTPVVTPTLTVTPTPMPTVAVPTEAVSVSDEGSRVDGYKVTIATPVGAEVYVDGSYVGVAPASFTKVSGKHEITLRLAEYLTRTYTIGIDNSQKDEVFSFADLVREDSEEESSDE